jgi:hypothetical protein
MAAHTEPRIYTFIADASIAKGKVVKVASGYTAGHVNLGAANTDRCIGIAQVEATASGQKIEVALQGGGAKGLLGEAVSAGEDLVSHTDGTLVKPNAEGDQIIARALEGGAANDLIAVEVIHMTAHAAIS